MEKVCYYALYNSCNIACSSLIPGIGKLVNNARRWIDIGPIQFQPSELAKYALVITLSTYFDHIEKPKSRFKVFVFSMFLTGLFFVLIYKEPNMSTCILILGISMLMLFAWGLNLGYFITMGALAVPVLYYLTTKEQYRVERIQALFNPWADPTDKGYQIIQSLYAIGSGGLLEWDLGRVGKNCCTFLNPTQTLYFQYYVRSWGLLELFL